MNTQLVEIQPRELKFVFEVKKQSVCTVYLANLGDHYVAFKVKTTSPKKYCVRPNVGIIEPKSRCDFTVTMQAQKSTPTECKDKFLIQSTVVPFGTTDDEITPAMFTKNSQKYIEETKLRVVLATAPNSPAKPFADVVLKQEIPAYETVSPKECSSPVLVPVNGFGSKQEQSNEMLRPKDNLQNGIENPPPTDTLNKEVEALKNVKSNEESRPLDVMDGLKHVPVKNEVLTPEKDKESKRTKDVEVAEMKLTREVEELRSKICAMDAELVEAQHSIEKLSKEKSIAIHERETVKQQLAMLRTKSESSSVTDAGKKVYVGFPPLYVCMVALIGLMIGLSFRA